MTVYEAHAIYHNNLQFEDSKSGGFSLGYYSSKDKAEKAIQAYNPEYFINRGNPQIIYHYSFKECEPPSSYSRVFEAIDRDDYENFIILMKVSEHPLDPPLEEQPWTH